MGARFYYSLEQGDHDSTMNAILRLDKDVPQRLASRIGRDAFEQNLYDPPSLCESISSLREVDLALAN